MTSSWDCQVWSRKEHLFLHRKSKAIKHKLISNHNSGVIMSAMASQNTGVSIVYSTVCSCVDKKHKCSASLAFFVGIQRWTVNSPNKRPVTRKTFPFDDVIMCLSSIVLRDSLYIPCILIMYSMTEYSKWYRNTYIMGIRITLTTQHVAEENTLFLNQAV